MSKPVCIQCQMFYRPAKTGFYWVEGMPKDNGAPPGKASPELWSPYKLWGSDKWRCDGCGSEIIVGHGLKPIKERHDPDFKEWINKMGATFQCNDC